MIHPSLDFPWYIYVWICNDTPKSGFHVILMNIFKVTSKSGFSMIHLLLVLACSTQVWFHQKFKIPCYTYFWIAMLYPSLGYLLLFHLLWGTYFCFIQFWGIQFCAPIWPISLSQNVISTSMVTCFNTNTLLGDKFYAKMAEKSI